MNAFCFHGMVIAPKIIRLKEQENSATALITDKTFLPFVRRTSQQNIAVAFRVGRDDYSAFTGLRRIFYEGKPQLVGVVFNGTIVVINHNSHAAEASFLCSHFRYLYSKWLCSALFHRIRARENILQTDKSATYAPGSDTLKRVGEKPLSIALICP